MYLEKGLLSPKIEIYCEVVKFYFTFSEAMYLPVGKSVLTSTLLFRKRENECFPFLKVCNFVKCQWLAVTYMYIHNEANDT